VWHENTDILGSYLDLFDIVSVRETRSFEEIQQFRPDARLVPDFSFAAFKNAVHHFDSSSFCQATRPGIHVLDSVNSTTAEHLREFAEINNFPFFLMGGVQASLAAQERTVFTVDGVSYPRVLRDVCELEGAELCVTGRFHGLIAALLKGIPTFALPSNTPKVEGLLADIRVTGRFHGFIATLLKGIPSFALPSNLRKVESLLAEIGISDIALLEANWLQLSNAERLSDLKDRAARWDTGVAKRVSSYATAAERKIVQLFNDMDIFCNRPRRKTGWVIRMKDALSHRRPL
jgi:polysaccharide pyruvyl transferase WcaK-like protein